MSVRPLDNKAVQLGRLQHFLRWLIPLTIILLVLQVATLIVVPHTAVFLLPQAIVTGIYTIVLFLSWTCVQRQQLQTAVLLICANLLGLAIAFAVIMPFALPALILIPPMALAIALSYVNGRTFRLLALVSLVVITTTAVINLFEPLFPAPPEEVLDIVLIGIIALASALVILAMVQSHRRLSETLAQSQAANQGLQEAQVVLETQVTERTADLQQALVEVEQRSAEQARLLDENRHQREVIREISVPVLPVGEGILVVPLIGLLDKERLYIVQQRSLKEITRTRARKLIVDVTGLPFIDEQVAQDILEMIRSARLLGAQIIIAGIRPEVAQALLHSGVALPQIQTVNDLHGAITLAQNGHTQ
ncbi:MAG: STAS domain-containing protein [Chloroflexota bacterium]